MSSFEYRSDVRRKKAIQESVSNCQDACKAIASFSRIKVGGGRTPTLFGKLPRDMIVLICGLIWETRKDIKLWRADPSIFAAIKSGLLHEVERMLEEDRTLANTRNIHGLTPLMYCISLSSRVEMAQLCLRKMAPKMIDTRDSCGRQSTALHMAARLGNVPIILSLLHRGADPTLMDNNGLTPAVVAKNNKRESAFLVLTNQRKPVLPFSLDNCFSFGPAFNREARVLLLCLHRLKMRMPKDVKGSILHRLYDSHFRSKQAWNAPSKERIFKRG